MEENLPRELREYGILWKDKVDSEESEQDWTSGLEGAGGQNTGRNLKVV